jgi:hypothetical protein
MEQHEQRELINNRPEEAQPEHRDASQDEELPTRFAEWLQMLRVPCSKTVACKHKRGCVEAILRDSSRITFYSYLIKCGLSTVFGIKRIFKSPSHLLKVLFSRDSLNFGLFVGSFVFIFRSILCALRRCVGEERQKYIPLLAGFVGGFISVMFLEKKTRQSFGLFLMARAIDITYQSLVKKGYLPEFKYFSVVLYCLMMGISGYAYGTEPGSMSPEMNKFYLTFTNETLSDMQMRQIWI